MKFKMSMNQSLLKRLKESFKTKTEETFRAMMRGAEKAGQVVETEAKSIFIKGGGSKQPAHPTRPTSRHGSAGILGKIATSLTKKSKSSVTYQIAPNSGGGEPVIYARRLEFGFYGTDSAGRTFAQPPRSFMREGARRGKDKAFQVFKNELLKVLKK